MCLNSSSPQPLRKSQRLCLNCLICKNYHHICYYPTSWLEPYSILHLPRIDLIGISLNHVFHLQSPFDHLTAKLPRQQRARTIGVCMYNCPTLTSWWREERVEQNVFWSKLKIHFLTLITLPLISCKLILPKEICSILKINYTVIRIRATWRPKFIFVWKSTERNHVNIEQTNTFENNP